MRACRGYTLISILIGLLLSVIVISGMMVAFRSTLQVIVPASQNAQNDGQRLSGLLRSSKLLQNAGFGVLTVSTVW